MILGWGVVTKEKASKRGNLKSAARGRFRSPKELKKETCLPRDTTCPQTIPQVLMTQWSGAILGMIVLAILSDLLIRPGKPRSSTS